MYGTIGPAELALLAGLGLLTVWPAWRVLRKAGFRPFLSIVAVVPFGVVLVLLYLAFARWPASEMSRR